MGNFPEVVKGSRFYTQPTLLFSQLKEIQGKKKFFSNSFRNVSVLYTNNDWG